MKESARHAPLIGIVAHESLLDDGVGTATRHHVTSVAYVKAVRKAGGVAVLLPMGDATDAEAAVASVDGVLVTGGADVNPDRYDAAVAPETNAAEPARDDFEFAVVQAAVRADVPLLCICRGIQVMNVALGGTLHQHYDEHSDIARYNEDVHEVRVEAGSVLAKALGATQVGVNSLHHQAVAEVAPAARAVAVSEDGVVEGIEADGCAFAVGVQWHPEFLRHRPEHLGLFEALVHAAQTHGA
jgi:putative glutamine amidotransferase